MFLIYGSPRSGTTRLCYDLDARVPDKRRVFNEPFHAVASTRLLFDSDYAGTTQADARQWLMSPATVAGIKLVANESDSPLAAHVHDLFNQVVIVHREPVDIAISLQASIETGNWNRGDGASSDYVPDTVYVHPDTLGLVRDHLLNVERFLRLRHRSGLGGVIEVNYSLGIDVAALARQLGLAPEPCRDPYRNIHRMRHTDSREERCSNLNDVIDFFERYRPI